MFVCDSGVVGGQGDGAAVHRRGVWWQHQTVAVPVPYFEDAADTTRERHRHRVYQAGRVQVSRY